MKIIIVTGAGEARTYLKSTSHLRVREKRGGYLRSVLVGLQFAVIHFPGEVLSVVLIPFVRNLLVLIYNLVSDVIFVTSGALSALLSGLSGYLEATETVEMNEVASPSENNS